MTGKDNPLPLPYPSDEFQIAVAIAKAALNTPTGQDIKNKIVSGEQDTKNKIVSGEAAKDAAKVPLPYPGSEVQVAATIGHGLNNSKFGQAIKEKTVQGVTAVETSSTGKAVHDLWQSAHGPAEKAFAVVIPVLEAEPLIAPIARVTGGPEGEAKYRAEIANINGQIVAHDKGRTSTEYTAKLADARDAINNHPVFRFSESTYERNYLNNPSADGREPYLNNPIADIVQMISGGDHAVVVTHDAPLSTPSVATKAGAGTGKAPHQK